MSAQISPQPLVVGEIIINPESATSKEVVKPSYASISQANQNASSKIELCAVNFDFEHPVIQFTMEDINIFTREEGLHQAVVIKFSYGKPDISEVRRVFSSQFDVKGRCNVGLLEYRHLLVRFDMFDDYAHFLGKTTGYLKSKGDEYFFRTFPWTFGFNPKEETSMAVVWISLPGLPPNLFAKRSLLSIASAVGKPIAVDKATQDRTRPSAARVKIIVNLLAKHPNKVMLQFIDSVSGKSVDFQQIIVYDNLPSYCTFCKHQGHSEKVCRLKNNKQPNSEKDNLANHSTDIVDKLQGDARDFLNEKRAVQSKVVLNHPILNKGKGFNDHQVKVAWKQKADQKKIQSAGQMQLSASADQNGQEIVSVHNDTISQSVMTLKDNKESDVLDLIPNAEDAEPQEISKQKEMTNLCSHYTTQISDSSVRFDLDNFNELTVNNVQYELDEKDKCSKVPMQMSCSPVKIDQECHDSKGQEKEVNARKKHESISKERDLSHELVSVHNDTNPQTVMTVKDKEEADALELTHNAEDADHQETSKQKEMTNLCSHSTIQISGSTVRFDQEKFKVLAVNNFQAELDEKEKVEDNVMDLNDAVIVDVYNQISNETQSSKVSGKQQLSNAPASYSADASPQKSNDAQINEFSRVNLTADHNSLCKPMENAVTKEVMKDKASASSGSQIANTDNLSNLVSNNSQEKTTICDDQFCNTMPKNAASLLNQDKQIVESKSPVLFTGGRIQSVISYPIIPYTYIEQKDHEVFSIFDGQNTPSVIPNRKVLIIKSKLWDQRQCEYEEGWEEGSSGSSSSEEDDDNSLAIMFSQENNDNLIEFVESTMEKTNFDKAEMQYFEEGEEEELLMQCRRDAARKGDLSPTHSKTNKKGRQRDKSWDGRVTEERIIRRPPMRVAKLKQLNQRA